MKMSVAMTTYNGEQFLREQLDSIFAQSRLPDEIVVCDDRSSDGTPEILREYAARAPWPMNVMINEERLGAIKNFEKAIDLCSGDIIVLCDQDDVWRPRKLAALEYAFDAEAELGVVLSNADLIDEDGRRLSGDLWSRCRFNKRRQALLRTSRRYDLLLGLPFATGATMAFRSHFKSLLLPLPAGSPTFFHDRWIAVLIAAVGQIGIIDEKLTAYRLHHRQQIGVSKWPLAFRVFVPHQCQSDAAALAAFDQRLKETPSTNSEFLHCLMERQRHIRARSQFSKNPFRRLQQVASEFRSGRYLRYPYGWAVPIQDLLVGTR